MGAHVLIDSPRLSPQDRDAWAALERYDHAIGATARMARMEERARGVIRGFAAAGRCYASTSWGKDSSCVAHLVATSGVRLPLVYVRMRLWENPDCIAVRDAFLRRHGSEVDYREYEVDGSPRWWQAGDGYAPPKAHAAGYFTQPERDFGSRHITGVRGEESRIRRIAQARWGDAGPGACRPIGSWKGTDVFAYLAKHDLPVHPAYAMSFGGRLDRIWLRVSPIGSITNSHKGRADWEAHYYRDVMDGKSTGDDT